MSKQSVSVKNYNYEIFIRIFCFVDVSDGILQ
jgi:hypothetical protein